MLEHVRVRQRAYRVGFRLVALHQIAEDVQVVSLLGREGRPANKRIDYPDRLV